ncbi:AzlC family ABC transporter permease, partial [Vibrio parahaemolyticus]|nr:AzlC family ABC transporter permease [Vibrio parahaemolyticus]
MTENTSSFPRSSGELHEFTRADVWGGFTQLLPLSFFVVVFGLAFGVAAVQTGLDAFPTLLMSTLVFAGASQFATLEMWGAEVPLVPVLITVFAINARHLLMGATLYPWLRQLPPHKRYGIM